VQGHCGATLREHKNTTIVLIPGAPHTLLNLPQAHTVVEAWLGATVGADARCESVAPAASGIGQGL